MKNPIFALMRVLTCALAGPNPSVLTKQKDLDEYAAEAVAAGAFNGDSVEIPRGAKNVKFVLDGTLFDRTTGDETYTFKVQGRNKSTDGWHDISGCGFTTVAATTASEQVPSAANAPGVVFPRFVRVVLTSVGTTPIATAVVRMLWDGETGPGKDAGIGYLGG